MISIGNNCCGCAVPAYPCLGGSCPLRRQKHYYCDSCGDEVDKLYRIDDGEYCEQCVLERLEGVE